MKDLRKKLDALSRYFKVEETVDFVVLSYGKRKIAFFSAHGVNPLEILHEAKEYLQEKEVEEMRNLKRLERELKRISPYFEMRRLENSIFLSYNFPEKESRDVIATYAHIDSREIFHDAYRWLRLLKRFKIREFLSRR